MTRDEVMAMSDEELRIKIAELDGWNRGAVLNGSVQMWYRTRSGGEGEAGWGHCETRSTKDIPDYPNDIAAAFALAERACLSVIRCDPEWWVGRFDGSNGDWWFVDDPVMEDSAPRAITRAFILSMEPS